MNTSMVLSSAREAGCLHTIVNHLSFLENPQEDQVCTYTSNISQLNSVPDMKNKAK